LRRDAAVVVEGDVILAVVGKGELPSTMRTEALPPGAWLAPGFIDIQVNGGGDVLLNDQPSPEGIRAIVRAHRRFGTTAMLPTLISDTREKMAAAIDAVQAVIADEPGVIGLHLEGPFLSRGKPGVHDPAMLRFDPTIERFESFPLPSSTAQVRQLLGRPGEVWGAESGTDKLAVIRTP